MQAIEKNMKNIFLGPHFLSFLPKEVCLGIVVIDGVATKECVNLDDSQEPHQVTGLCRHCVSTTFNTFKDAMRIQKKLELGEIHFAKEAEVFCIALNHEGFTSVIPVCIAPTCKKNDVVHESTDTVREIISTIMRKWFTLPISKTVIMSTVASDGAPQFRKAAGQVLNKDLPKNVRDVYISPQGAKRCLLLDLIGSSEGVTATCDNDHLGKRFRARVKSVCGLKIGVFIFTKSDISLLMGKTRIVSSPKAAHKLFHPDDLMDVLETVLCLHAVGRLSNIPFSAFPVDWRSVSENQQKFKEMRVLGLVSKLMCVSIVGHYDNVQEEGNHLSISEYLTMLSELAHVLFFLFRRNKTDFIATQNYRNWQEMIKNMFISVTLAKVNGVKHFYWFLNTNKKIEEFFGILRSMRKGNLNFDCLDLRNRAADAGLVQ